MVTIELKGHSANLLIEQVLLKSLDLIVEPKTRKLIPNLASSEILMTTMYNSGYAVCSHSQNLYGLAYPYTVRRRFTW